MKYFATTLIFGVLTSFSVCANAWDVTIRDKAKEPPKKENGAALLYTNPDEGESSYKIDAAINITKKERDIDDLFNHNFALEVHRSTQTDKEVDVKSLSYSYGSQWLSNGDKVTSYHKVPTKVEYKLDDIKDTESAVASISYYPEVQLNERKQNLFNIGKDIFIGKYEEGGPQPARINWQPFIGVSYEDVIKSDTLGKGSVTRVTAGLNINLNLTEDRVIMGQDDEEKHVETLVLSMSYQYWKDVDKDEAAFGTDDNHDIRIYKVSYPLDLEGDMKIYASYLDGEDPVKGKPEQKYSEVGLEFKVDI